jgi:hypothetical protein
MLTWVTKDKQTKKLSELSPGYLVNIKKFIQNSPKWKLLDKTKFITAIQEELDKRDEENKAFFDKIMKPFIDKAKTGTKVKRINPVTKELEEINSQFFANYN